jgi:hypothetical protein
MPEFKGFDDWIPIFGGGKQTDSMGREHDGDALIEKAVANFNAAKHEPPVVIGHPADNAPAYGWVEGLKKEGRLLLAKFKQVQPDFAQMVKDGLFKKRSAAFYPDGSLRHVGFLGAMPPAVKGLPDVAFTAGDEAIIVEFEDPGDENQQQTKNIEYRTSHIESEIRNSKFEIREKEDNKMNFKEFIKTLKELVGTVEPPEDDDLAANKNLKFSEADIEAAKKEAADEAAKKEREKVTAEFAEKGRLDRSEARKKEISAWCDAQIAAGKMTPAMVKYGVPEMLSAFAEKEDVIEFGETKEKATLFDRFKGLFETELPKVVEFKEIATREKAISGGNAAAKIETLIAAKRKENKGLGYTAAFSEVQRENPDLAREYQQEIGK